LCAEERRRREVRERELAAARHRPTAEAAIHARCRQPTGGEQGRDCAAFKRLVLSSAAGTTRHTSRQRRRLFALQHARGGVSLSSAFPQQHIKHSLSRRDFRSIAAKIAYIAPSTTCFI